MSNVFNKWLRPLLVLPTLLLAVILRGIIRVFQGKDALARVDAVDAPFKSAMDYRKETMDGEGRAKIMEELLNDRMKALTDAEEFKKITVRYRAAKNKSPYLVTIISKKGDVESFELDEKGDVILGDKKDVKKSGSKYLSKLLQLKKSAKEFAPAFEAFPAAEQERKSKKDEADKKANREEKNKDKADNKDEKSDKKKEKPVIGDAPAPDEVIKDVPEGIEPLLEHIDYGVVLLKSGHVNHPEPVNVAKLYEKQKEGFDANETLTDDEVELAIRLYFGGEDVDSIIINSFSVSKAMEDGKVKYVVGSLRNGGFRTFSCDELSENGAAYLAEFMTKLKNCLSELNVPSYKLMVSEDKRDAMITFTLKQEKINEETGKHEFVPVPHTAKVTAETLGMIEYDKDLPEEYKAEVTAALKSYEASARRQKLHGWQENDYNAQRADQGRVFHRIASRVLEDDSVEIRYGNVVIRRAEGTEQPVITIGNTKNSNPPAEVPVSTATKDDLITAIFSQMIHKDATRPEIIRYKSDTLLRQGKTPNTYAEAGSRIVTDIHVPSDQYGTGIMTLVQDVIDDPTGMGAHIPFALISGNTLLSNNELMSVGQETEAGKEKIADLTAELRAVFSDKDMHKLFSAGTSRGEMYREVYRLFQEEKTPGQLYLLNNLAFERMPDDSLLLINLYNAQHIVCRPDRAKSVNEAFDRIGFDKNAIETPFKLTEREVENQRDKQREV